ncbi:hypothetical protein FRC01_008992, partial [Tulasnella sp. 417]
MVVQTEEAEEEENQAVDPRKTRGPPCVRNATTTPTLPTKPGAILRPRSSDSDMIRPNITPSMLAVFGLSMRTGLRKSGTGGGGVVAFPDFGG